MKSKPLSHAIGLSLLLGTLAAGQVIAQTADPKTLGVFKAWNTFTVPVDGQTTCYALTDPEDSLPKNVRHGDVVFMVTNWPGEKNVPSFITGYKFKDGSTVTAEIGSTKWDLFTTNNSAWLREQGDEAALIKAMKSGNTLRVKGTSDRGTATEYRFSLSGVTAAINSINKSCS